jgi:hypothetical protein
LEFGEAIGPPGNMESVMGDLEDVLPKDLKVNAVPCGRELVLPYTAALGAIRIATGRAIAVLGVEAFEVKDEGLLTVDMDDASRCVPYTGNWGKYVAEMNAEAERWIREHRLGENHGYILASASQREFASLKSS